MTVALPLRVRVRLDDRSRAAWHDRVVDGLRGPNVDVLIASSVRSRDGGEERADVVVDLAGGHIDDEPRFGVLQYRFGDGAPFADGARGTIARLCRAGRDSGEGVVLREGWFRAPTDNAPGIVNAGDYVAHWCGQVVHQMTIDGECVVNGPAVSLAGCADLAPPTHESSVVVSAREALGRWRRRERWTIGLLRTTVDLILERGAMPEPMWLRGVATDRYYADPFPLGIRPDTVTLLAEEFEYRRGRGRITEIDVSRDGTVMRVQPLLDMEHHASYPFILRDDNETLCVPEMSQTGGTRAFSPSSDVRTLLTICDDIPAVDPTIVRHAGRWWLFCTHPGPMNQTELYVYHADTWRGPWAPHRLNPVKSDARSSRPAGALFTSGADLYRPAQDCSRRYGGAIAVNRVVELTPTRFREEVACTLRPATTWTWPDGLHTLNALGDTVVVDALRVER